MDDEEELQEILDTAPEPIKVESIVTYNGEETFFQFVKGKVRVQERRQEDGQIMQRVKDPYIGGEWTDWYSALESWAVKR